MIVAGADLSALAHRDTPACVGSDRRWLFGSPRLR